jgi:AMMECR1 domain-containing protein
LLLAAINTSLEASLTDLSDAVTEPPASCTPTELLSVAIHAYKLLCSRFDRKLATDDCCGPLPSIAFDRLNVTIHAGGKLRASMSAYGCDLPGALKIAADRALDDKRYGGVLRAGELERLVVEVWIQVFCDDLPSNDLATLQERMELGLHGLEIRCGDREAYFKPSVPLTSNLVSHEQVIQHLCRKAGLSPDSWHTVPMRITVTHWMHAILHTPSAAQGCVSRRLRLAPTLRRDTVIARMRDAAFHLTQVQAADGSYCYRYHPFTDEADNAGFNMVRMAGCAYAMSAAAATGFCEADWCMSSASRAIGFVLRHLRSSDHSTYISEFNAPGEGKLGSAALLVRALQAGSFRHDRLKERESLITGILNMQTQDGRFAGFVHNPIDLQTGQDYFPGEALSALSSEQEAAFQNRCRDAVRKAFAPYVQHFRRRPASAFVLWQVETWAKSWEWLVDEDERAASDYADFVFELADWILRLQYTESTAPDQDYIGGYDPPRVPTISTAVYTEAIIIAYTLAVRLRSGVRIERYLAAARAGLAFILKLQIPAEFRGLFQRPELAVGGLTAGLNSFLIRCDYDQHFITAALAALNAPALLD